MFLQRLWQWLNRTATGTRARSSPQRRARLMVEPLEDRAVPANFTAATVPELIAGITAANQSAEADTITLATGTNFTLKTDLPGIAAAGGPVTIIGNNDFIERSTAGKTPVFRIFTVEPGASLTLEHLTLQGGKSSIGGAIYNAGALIMTGVTVQNNAATYGGGIYSDGSLTMQDCLIQNNQAVGGDGTDGFRVTVYLGKRDGYLHFLFPPTDGGWGVGGGVCIAGGTAELLRTTVTHNSAKGGRGGSGKYGQPNAPDGFGQGGGIAIESDAAAILDAFTAAHVTANTADLGPDIHGTFTVSS
jgi:predicted outer membrane repeat protein